MWLNRRRTENPKTAMLKGVYLDNMRMSGKLPQERPTLLQRPLFRKTGRALLIVLGLAIVSFSFHGWSVSNSRVHAPAAQPAATAAVKGLAPSNKAMAAAQPQTQEPDGASVMEQIPIWDFDLPGDQKVADYNLLLSGNDHIRLSTLFGLDVKTIIIDPGHGGADPGAIGLHGIKEKEITLDVAQRLKESMQKQGGYNILLTRTEDRTLSLAERVAFAKEHKADLFISVHVNSLPDRAVNIIETYYFGPPLTSDTLQLAEQENKESHYTIRELDAIVQDIGNTVKRQESARLAASIQDSLFRNVKHHDAKVKDFGIKMAPFVVLSQIEVPSVLVEISCLTQKNEEKKLASAEYRAQIASYIEEGVGNYLDVQHFKTLSGVKQNERK
ncbi:MAG: N-acetylmuramoyl-L-alanine amidase [Desulfobacteraceae bacterium]|nr:N-acetylmuramoyl-L-alanine amidase [Desulfobacteraceae bacterium]